MYFRCNNGGWNKTHEQAEQMPRIDSFELKHTHAWGGYSAAGNTWTFTRTMTFARYSPQEDTKSGYPTKPTATAGNRPFFFALDAARECAICM